MMTEEQVIAKIVPADWTRMTTLAQIHKGKRQFGFIYSNVIRAMHSAADAGIIEIKRERAHKAGPWTKFVRRAQ